MRVLMIIAHPDDEAIFGFRDLVYNDATVICMTNGDNIQRKKEFFESMEYMQLKGHILSFIDSPTEIWLNKEIEDFYSNDIKPLLRDKYEMVVSHGTDGEYGNLQHIRVNMISRNIARELNIPFKCFRDRYRPSDIPTNLQKYNHLLEIYKSQQAALVGLYNFFENDNRKKNKDNGKVKEGKKPDRTLFLRPLV